MSTFPLYYGAQILLQANSYGPGWLGTTPLANNCGSGLIQVPDTMNGSFTPYTQNEASTFTILNSAGQMPTSQTQVKYGDTITIQQFVLNKLWTVVPKCRNNAGIAIGLEGATTATYTIVPQNSANANQPIVLSAISVPNSSTSNAFYLESNQQAKYYVTSSPDGVGVTLESSAKTWFQAFLISTPSPPSPPSPSSCTTSAQCNSGYQCISGTCQQGTTTSCTNSSSCPAGQSCVNNTCQQTTTCTSSATCPSGFNCINGSCQPPCTENSDCPTNMQCSNGTCVTPACSQNSDCPSGYFCNGNQCTINPSCTSSSQCQSGYVCTSGTCTPAPAQCTTNSNCKFYEKCETGNCKLNTLYPIAFGGGIFVLILIIVFILAAKSKKSAPSK